MENTLKLIVLVEIEGDVSDAYFEPLFAAWLLESKGAVKLEVQICCAFTFEPHIKRKGMATQRREARRASIAAEKTHVQDISNMRKTDAYRLKVIFMSWNIFAWVVRHAKSNAEVKHFLITQVTDHPAGYFSQDIHMNSSEKEEVDSSQTSKTPVLQLDRPSRSTEDLIYKLRKADEQEVQRKPASAYRQNTTENRSH